MDTAIIKLHNAKEKKLLIQLAKLINIKIKFLSDEEKEDIALLLLIEEGMIALLLFIEEGMKTKSVSEDRIMKKLKRG